MLVKIKYGEQVREAIHVIFNWFESVLNFVSKADVEKEVVWYLGVYMEFQ